MDLNFPRMTSSGRFKSFKKLLQEDGERNVKVVFPSSVFTLSYIIGREL